MAKKNQSKKKNTKKKNAVRKSEKPIETTPIEAVKSSVAHSASPEKSTTKKNTEGVSLSQDTNKSNKKTQPQRNPELAEKRRDQIFSVILGAIGIAAVIAIAFVWIPSIVKQTDDARLLEEQAEVEQQERDEEQRVADQQELLNEQIAFEEEYLTFAPGQVATMTTNFGDLTIDLAYDEAPIAVENFMRLSFRDYYDNVAFHRIVELEGFNVIQGGDPLENGTGGEAFNGTAFEDEVWEVEPEFDTQNNLLNEPALRDPTLLRDLDLTTGTVTYPKGSIAMANSGPDTNGSQFFIMLTDTTLPAAYTAFGQIREDSFAVLDRIAAEVDPVNEAGQLADNGDGQTSQEILIEDVTIQGVDTSGIDTTVNAIEATEDSSEESSNELRLEVGDPESESETNQ